MDYKIPEYLIEKYNKIGVNNNVPRTIFSEDGTKGIETKTIDGIVTSDGKYFYTAGNTAYHDFICFLLKEMSIDTNNAVRICKNPLYPSGCSISAAKYKGIIMLTKEQIVTINNLLSKLNNQSWTSIIVCKSVFDLGLNDNENRLIGIANLQQIRSTLESDFDYETCLSSLKEDWGLTR